MGVAAVKKLLMKKIWFSKNDEVGIVLVGTKDSKNPLVKPGSRDYQHVTVFRDVDKVDLDTVKTLDTIASEDCEGDILDGIVVGIALIEERVKVSPEESPASFTLCAIRFPAHLTVPAPCPRPRPPPPIRLPRRSLSSGASCS